MLHSRKVKRVFLDEDHPSLHRNICYGGGGGILDVVLPVLAAVIPFAGEFLAPAIALGEGALGAGEAAAGAGAFGDILGLEGVAPLVGEGASTAAFGLPAEFVTASGATGVAPLGATVSAPSLVGAGESAGGDFLGAAGAGAAGGAATAAALGGGPEGGMEPGTTGTGAPSPDAGATPPTPTIDTAALTSPADASLNPITSGSSIPNLPSGSMPLDAMTPPSGATPGGGSALGGTGGTSAAASTNPFGLQGAESGAQLSQLTGGVTDVTGDITQGGGDIAQAPAGAAPQAPATTSPAVSTPSSPTPTSPAVSAPPDPAGAGMQPLPGAGGPDLFGGTLPQPVSGGVPSTGAGGIGDFLKGAYGGVKDFLSSNRDLISLGAGGSAIGRALLANSTVPGGMGGIADLLRSNALTLQNLTQPVVNEGMQIANTGQNLVNQGISGNVIPGTDQNLAASKAAAQAKIRSKYAGLGMTGSTPETQELAQLDQQFAAGQGNLALNQIQTGGSLTSGAGNFINSGIQAAGLSSNPAARLAILQAQQDADLNNALSRLAAAAGGAPTTATPPS